MAGASKFTDEQKLEIALELLAGKLSASEVCRKWDISSTYAYKLKDRALEVLRGGIGQGGWLIVLTFCECVSGGFEVK